MIYLKRVTTTDQSLEPADPALMRPLAQFAGLKPPAPGWFNLALSEAPERTMFDVDGADIEMLCWGQRGAPGIVLVHGTNAHADWWSHIAPALATNRRVVALSNSGMGRSAWRAQYSVACYVREVIAVAQAGGVFEGPQAPIAIGHSFGGLIVAETMALAGDRFAGAVLADTMLTPVSSDMPELSRRPKPKRVMASVEQAVARFRLSPPQDVENFYVLDHIARHSLKTVPGGVTWAFDPSIIGKIGRFPNGAVVARARAPLALMRGERSRFVNDAMFDYAIQQIGRAVPRVVVPDADHHLLIDQPLAFIAALRGLLAAWPAMH